MTDKYKKYNQKRKNEIERSGLVKIQGYVSPSTKEYFESVKSSQQLKTFGEAIDETINNIISPRGET
jgi:hypothetical protein|tara:strand:+ start:2763 stop:2963 length:201 start_codon:yes stop_codon:yes gene_type:complete